MEHEDFVTYEQAQQLKELGFDWECYQFYNADKNLWSYTSIGYGDDCRDWNDKDYAAIGNSECSAPTLSQVQKWFREIHGIDIDSESVYYRLDTGNKIMYGLRIGIQRTFQKEFYLNYDSYNEALSKGITHALKFIQGGGDRIVPNRII